MDSLTLAFTGFKQFAAELTDYTKISVNDLADNYCAATDKGEEHLRNVYFSALVLRFWYKINKIYSENLSLGIEKDDCLTWLTGAIMMACEPDKRAWQNDTKLNAQQVINQTLATRFIAAAYYDSNLQKNQGKHTTISFDSPVSDTDEATTVGDLLPDDATGPESNFTNFIIQEYIEKHQVVDAIILDIIITKNVFKSEKKVVKASDGTKHLEYYNTFWPFRVVKELNKLSDDYINYFYNNYDISSKELNKAVNTLSSIGNPAKYKMISNVLNDVKVNYCFI